MKRILFCGFFLLSICVANAQTYYYKLTKEKIQDKISTNVSGGQFITFISDICYESDKNGIGVGHGTLKINKKYTQEQYISYVGNSFWGEDVIFKFTKDYTLLNVITDDGHIYLYLNSANFQKFLMF